MKRDAAEQSLLYRVACCVASLAFTSPLSVQCRSLRLFVRNTPFCRDFLAMAVRFSGRHGVYCLLLLYPALLGIVTA